MKSADHKNVGVEEGPRGRNSAQKVMGDTHGTALDDGKRTGLDGRSHLQLVVSPDDGLDQLLPVATAAEQEHQAECPDEVGSEEHQAIGTGVRAIAVDHLNGLSPQEVTQPAINGDGALGEVAIGDMRDGTIGIHGPPDVTLHLPGEVEDHNGQGVVHPEQTQEHVVPGRHLAGATTAGAVAGEAEAQVGFIWNQAGAAGVEHTLQQDQHRHVNREGVDVVHHEVGRAERHGRSGDLATNGHNRAVEHFAHAGKGVRSGAAGCCCVGVLDPLGEDRLNRNRRVTKHVLGTAQGTHGVVVDIQAEAVGSEPDAHPVQVADDRVARLEHPIQHVVDVLGGVIVADHGDRRVSGATDDQESTDPHVVGEQTDLCRVIDGDVRIRRHGVHVLSHDDAQRAEHRQVQAQLGVPGGRQEFIETVMTVGSREQQGITLLTFVDLLDGVTDAPVRAVHVTGNDEQDGDRHMVMCDIGHPETARDRIQPTFEGEEVAVSSPVA